MGRTTNFGLSKFGSEGRLSDDGFKYTLKDREIIDALLWTLVNHDHQRIGSETEPLQGPPSTSFPDLTVLSTGGTLTAGRNYYYKISYVDSDGNETAASPAIGVNTPLPISPPQVMVAVPTTTGGTLTPGTYKYAFSYYQTGIGETTAPNIITVVVPAGTSTNKITITLETPPDDATGWKVYRKGPGDVEYWLTDTIPAPDTEWVDDGSLDPDCTKKRPTVNSTNSTNSIEVAIPAEALPLDPRVAAWRIYRTGTAGVYAAESLVAHVTDTVTETGTELVTTYTDVGGLLSLGIPLEQTAVPPPIPQLDASRMFGSGSGRLPSALAPLGVQAFNSFLPGTLTAKDYNQFTPPFDMSIERIEAFFITAPTGVDSNDFVRIRISDPSTVDEVQHVWNESEPRNEFQSVHTTATGGTFTLTFNGQTTTALDFNATSTEINDALEALSNIVAVGVTGSGTAAVPWIVEFLDPGEQNVVEMTADSTNLVGGTAVISTTQQGSDGGTFQLTFEIDPIEVVSITPSVFGSDTTAHLVAMPAVVDATDLLVTVFVNDGNATVTTPGGWTLLATSASGTAVRTSVYWRDADGTEDGTTVDFVTSAGEQASAQVFRIAGWDGVTAPAISTAATGTSVNPSAGSLNPSGWDVENTLWLVVYGADDQDDLTLYPTNHIPGEYTESSATATAASMGSAYKIDRVASHGPGSFTIAASEEWSAFTIGIRPMRDFTDAIAFDASAATVATRLETDIPAIVDVTVTGAGTEADPWVVTFVDPGDQDVPLLGVIETEMNGPTTIIEVTRGRAATSVDLDVQTTDQYQVWQSSLTDADEQEAEDSPATGGIQVSDNFAGNDSAAELDATDEVNSWPVGVLDEGDYVAEFYVSDTDQLATFKIEVIDDIGPTVVASAILSPARALYTPAYELSFTSTGVEDYIFQVTKLDAGSGRVRVDRYAYSLLHPTLHAGFLATVEVLIEGAPSTNGADVQLTLWY